jgi:hypothetical protein
VLRVSRSDGDAHLVLFSLYDREATQAQRDAARETVLTSIRETLPAYMCPARAVLLEEYPRNHNGKIDHDSLRAMHHAHDPAPTLHAADGHAETVRAIWEQVLGQPVVAPDKDFFDGGGTSLDLIRIMQETKNQLAVEVDLGTFADGLSFDRYVDHVGDQLASRGRTTAERCPS